MENFDVARIRTVKPELFRHEGLYELERDTGLPVRVAFIGLFTAADRDGRFKWRPRELQLDVMPYDTGDFSRVLDALGTRGFIQKYQVENEWFGVIPTFRKHQVINNRERVSELPPISSASRIFTFNNSHLPTRESHVNDASATRHGNVQGEGKGREGKEDQDQDQKLSVKFDQKSAFDIFWKLYPRKVSKAPAEKKFMTKCKDAETFSKIIRSVGEHIEGAWSLAEMNFIPHAATWLNQERWNDEVSHVRPNTTGTNAGTNRQSSPSLSEQVRQRNAAAQAERQRQAGHGPASAAELFEPGMESPGIDWEGEFSRIDVTDGKIVGVDD